jgi:phage terminase large subunit-like protein
MPTKTKRKPRKKKTFDDEVDFNFLQDPEWIKKQQYQSPDPPPSQKPTGTRTRAQRNIAWCEKYLRLPEGKNVGQPLQMADFMKEDFIAIYDNPNITRRAILTRGRKNAKTTECAAILLLHLCGYESRVNSSMYSLAQSREQASLLFTLAAKMVRLDARLRALVLIKDSAKELYCLQRGTKYKALSAEASTAFGLSPSLCIFDEAGQIRGPRSSLFEAMETATAAQEEPLTIIISTQAPTDADLLSILIDDAKAGHDPRVVLRMQQAPPEMDPFSEEAIRAANPAFDIFMNKTEVLAMAADAKRMPARQAEYENLVLNRRVEANNPFIAPGVWKACGGEVGDLHGLKCYAGLDLSETNDLTALVLIAELNGKWHVKPWFWLPEEGLREKSNADHVPYTLWRTQEFLYTTPGAAVSYEYVSEFLFDLFQHYKIDKLAFDRWNFKHLLPWLHKAGFKPDFIAEHFVEFGQGMQSMSPALRELEQIILEGKLCHGNHPILTMCVGNSTVVRDDAGNRKLSKRKSIGRIDGTVALTMAMGMAPLQPAFDIESLIG